MLEKTYDFTVRSYNESHVQSDTLKLALAAQFCYFDTGIDYMQWKHNHTDYDHHHFGPFFRQLISAPRKIEFSDKKLGYFVGLVETNEETIIVCPGTRKTFQGLQDLGCKRHCAFQF